MPEEEALRITVHRQTDRRRHRLMTFLGTLLLIGFVLQLGYFVIARELFPLGAAPPFVYSMADLEENDTFWLELERDGFPELQLKMTLLQSTDPSNVIFETSIQGNGKTQIKSTPPFYTKNFTHLETKATSILHLRDTSSTWEHQSVIHDIVKTEVEATEKSGKPGIRSIALTFKKPTSVRDYYPVTPLAHPNSNFDWWNLSTSLQETNTEEAGNQLNTGYEETARTIKNDVEETHRKLSSHVVANQQDHRTGIETFLLKLSSLYRTVGLQREATNINSSPPILDRPSPSPLQRILPSPDTISTSPPDEQDAVEESLVDVHRRDWETVNNNSFCREWRFERQNWTAIMTGRISHNRSTSCPNPYNYQGVKRILFQNFSEELIGCTRDTPRCPESPTFSEEFNIRINVPPCCQRHLLEIYRHIETELTNLNVTHFMIGGGVIGWMRNKRMVPYDDDLDVLVPLNFWKTDDFWEFVWRMSHIHRMPCRLVEETKMKIYYSELNQINVDMWPYFFVHKKKKRRKRRTKKNNTSGRRRMTKKKSQSILRHTSRKKKVSSRKKRSSKVKKRKMRTTDYGVGTMIDIPYKNFKLQPPSNLLPPKQVVFENFLVFMPNKPKAYLDRQYGVGKWEHELTCRSVDSDNSCEA